MTKLIEDDRMPEGYKLIMSDLGGFYYEIEGLASVDHATKDAAVDDAWLDVQERLKESEAEVVHLRELLKSTHLS